MADYFRPQSKAKVYTVYIKKAHNIKEIQGIISPDLDAKRLKQPGQTYRVAAAFAGQFDVWTKIGVRETAAL